MANRKDERLSEIRFKYATQLPIEYKDAFDKLREDKEIVSYNDAIIQAVDYWLIHCKGFKDEQK